MATLVIKNLPDDLHAALKKRAANNRRSLTKEAVTLLEAGVQNGTPPTSKKLPKPVALKGGRLTLAEIESAIAEGQD